VGIRGDGVHAVALVPVADAAVAKVDAMARRCTPRLLCAPYCNRTISAEARGVLEATLRRGYDILVRQLRKYAWPCD
jgi:hypothetical protein